MLTYLPNKQYLPTLIYIGNCPLLLDMKISIVLGSYLSSYIGWHNSLSKLSKLRALSKLLMESIWPRIQNTENAEAGKRDLYKHYCGIQPFMRDPSFSPTLN